MRCRPTVLSMAVTAALVSIAAFPSFAQYDIYSRGSERDRTSRDSGRDRDRERRHAPPAWTGGIRFLPGSSNHGYQPAIIINSSPCYLPGYYAGLSDYGSYGSYGGYAYGNPGYGGYAYGGAGYGSFGMSVGGFTATMQVGPLGFGYQQTYTNNLGGYYGYSVPAAPTTPQYSVREYAPPVDTGYSRVAERRPPAVTPTTNSGDDDYYLHRKPAAVTKNPGLADAIRDIETAFRTGNMTSLEKHIDRAGKIVLQVKGTTRQDMSASDYVSMTEDALKVMKTSRYELDRVEPASNGAMMVTGTHTLRTEDGQQKSFTVGFILKPSGDNWIITEVSAEPK